MPAEENDAGLGDGRARLVASDLQLSGLQSPVSSGLSETVRVMHVVHCLGSNGRTGGMEYGVIKLVNALDRARVVSGVCSTRLADPAISRLLDPAVSYRELDGRRGGNDPRLVWSMRRVFREFRPHIVHTHSWGTLIEGMLAAKLARVPVVVHGEHGTRQTKRRQVLVQRFVWKRVDQLLSVSSRLAESLVREVGIEPERIHTIRNGVDLSRFGRVARGDARRSLGLDDQSVVLGTVGRLVEVKDHSTLLRAFALVARECRRAVLLLAGEGPLGTALEAQARELDIADRVRFLGHRPDVERVLAALDVFVLSSLSEGMSNTILEAMASGVAVVATAVGGADELVVEGVTGLLVPRRDPEAMAAAMLSITTDDVVRRRMAIAGYERAQAEFALQRMVMEYENLYARLYAERTAGNVAFPGDPSAVPDRRTPVATSNRVRQRP